MNQFVTFPPRGNYFLTLKENAIDRDRNLFDNKFRVYDNNFVMQYETGIDQSLGLLDDTGNSFIITNDYHKIMIVNMQNEIIKTANLSDTVGKLALSQEICLLPFYCGGSVSSLIVSYMEGEATNYALQNTIIGINDNLEPTKKTDIGDGKQNTLTLYRYKLQSNC